MEEVFEDYVVDGFRRHQRDYRVITQGPQKPFARIGKADAFHMKPDIALVRAGEVRFVLDAKWKKINGDSEDPKHGISQDDVYQLYSYGRKFGCAKVALIYPKTPEFDSPLRYEFNDRVAGQRLALLCIRSMFCTQRSASPKSCVYWTASAPPLPFPPPIRARGTNPMTPLRPLAALPTHEVTNMPPHLGDQDLWGDDAALREGVEREGGGQAADRLAGFGRRAGAAETFEKAELANRNAPELKSFDRYGMRIDQVAFHPAYHDLMGLAIENEVPSFAWRHPGPGAHVSHAALTYLFSQAEGGG